MIQIAFINQSTVVTDADAQNVMAALQIQMDRDYLPIWGKTAKLTFYSAGTVKSIPATYFQLCILDNSDQAGALGYHDLTESGMPLGKIFAATDIQYGETWSSTASHELLEMLQDPAINLTATSADGNTLYAFEVCDSPENQSYDINGVQVSDFVTPAWFEPDEHPAGTQFDFMNLITAPFQLLSGGYIGILNLSGNSGWTQLTDEKIPALFRKIPHIGSRRERRARGRHNWFKSVIKV